MWAIIEDSLVIARPQPAGGFNFTLASWLGKMLRQAEKLYGERDKSYTILGVEFRDSVPQIWFHGADRKNVVVQLGLPRCRTQPSLSSNSPMRSFTCLTLAPVRRTTWRKGLRPPSSSRPFGTREAKSCRWRITTMLWLGSLWAGSRHLCPMRCFAYGFPGTPAASPPSAETGRS
jgi:hypothetical protein